MICDITHSKTFHEGGGEGRGVNGGEGAGAWRGWGGGGGEGAWGAGDGVVVGMGVVGRGWNTLYKR